jgi:hypothetical protein
MLGKERARMWTHSVASANLQSEPPSRELSEASHEERSLIVTSHDHPRTSTDEARIELTPDVHTTQPSASLRRHITRIDTKTWAATIMAWEVSRPF